MQRSTLLWSTAAALFVAALVGKTVMEAWGADPAVHARRRAEVIEMLETIRQGHLRGDAGQFLAGAGSTWLRVSDGSVSERILAHQRESIERYLAATDFLAVDFIAPPRVELSGDGTMAWAAATVDVCARNEQGAIGFRSAFLHVYRRERGGWVRAAEASTERPLGSACPERSDVRQSPVAP